MYAAVDLGSNSFRLHIGYFENGTIHIVKSARAPIFLGAGLNAHQELTTAALQKAVEALSDFREVLRQYELHAVRIVATNTMRIAKNAAACLIEMEKAIGYPIEVISGEEEGRLIYMGVAKALTNPKEARLVIDIGGGSTEVIMGRGTEILRVASFPVGTVKQSLDFFENGFVSDAMFDAAILSARSQFEDAASLYLSDSWDQVYGSSGSIRSIAEVLVQNKIGDGQLTLLNLEKLKARCIEVGKLSQLSLAGIKAERISMVVGGCVILIGLMQALHIHTMDAIQAGLRMGVMWDLHLRDVRHDRREEAVRALCKTFHVNQQRAQVVSELARILYDQLKPNGITYVAQLMWAAKLHEVGMVVSQTSYHKHGAYLMEYADIEGFTTREQRNMSRLILAQKGSLRKVQDWLADIDFAKAILALRLAILFMHTHLELSLAQVKLRMKNKIELEIRSDWLEQHPTLGFWLEKEQQIWAEMNVNFLIRLIGTSF